MHQGAPVFVFYAPHLLVKNKTPATRGHQGAPGGTRRHQGAPGGTRGHQGAPGSRALRQERHIQGGGYAPHLLVKNRIRGAVGGAHSECKQRPGLFRVSVAHDKEGSNDGVRGNTVLMCLG